MYKSDVRSCDRKVFIFYYELISDFMHLILINLFNLIFLLVILYNVNIYA